MENKIDLEELLPQLRTDEGRARVISRLVGKIDVPEQYVNMAIDVYKKAGLLADAAEIAHNAGLIDKSKALYVQEMDGYEKAGWFVDAAEAAQNAGLTDKAKLYNKLEQLLSSF